MKFAKFGCLMALVTTPLILQAESLDVKRIEIEKERSVEFMSCDAIGEHGLILTTKEDHNQKGTKKGHEKWTFTKYDTLLNKVSSVDAEVNPDNSIFASSYRYNKQFTKDNNLYYISVEKNGEYEIVIVDGETMKTSTLTGDFGKKSDISFSRVMGDYVYFTGTQKDLPFVYTVNTKSGAGKMSNISVANKKRFSIMSFESDDEQNEVHLFIKEKQENVYVMKLYVFADGALTNEMTLAPDAEDKYTATAFASKMSDGSYVISGTYSKKDGKGTQNSIGVFLKKVENGKSVYSTYVNYLDLKNFTSYMTERKQKRVEKKKEKKEEKGDEYTINYNMLPYKIIEENGKYMLVGEAYYPTYVMQPYTQVMSNGQGGTYTVTNYRMVFDGYFYTHYFVLAFDQQGQMVWSNSAPLEVLKSWYVHRHLSLNKKSDALEIFYPSFGHMNHVSYNYNGEETLKEEVKYVEDDVKLKRYAGLDTQFWYGNTFLSSGLLKIKDDDGKRKIYSINRVKCGK